MFALDIRGHLNSLRLAESKALWPLFEAVVNSIQSIEDSPNRDNGKITIFAQREDQDPNLTIQKDVLERFESFVIEDNGNGMNTANYRSFNTAYSTLKIQKGCKGIGRFLWLKAFETVEIESVFQEDRPAYRYLLHNRPNVYDLIPAGLKKDALELELHKHFQSWEHEIQKQGKDLEKAAKDAANQSDTTYQALFEKYLLIMKFCVE